MKEPPQRPNGDPANGGGSGNGRGDGKRDDAAKAPAATTRPDEAAREMVEARLVALIYGEASDFEEADLHRAMAEDAALAALYEEMESAADLLGEALSDAAEDGRTELPTLTPERREKVLAAARKAEARAAAEAAAPAGETAADTGDGETRRRKRGRAPRIYLAALAVSGAAAAVLALASLPAFLTESKSGHDGAPAVRFLMDQDEAESQPSGLSARPALERRLPSPNAEDGAQATGFMEGFSRWGNVEPGAGDDISSPAPPEPPTTPAPPANYALRSPALFGAGSGGGGASTGGEASRPGGAPGRAPVYKVEARRPASSQPGANAKAFQFLSLAEGPIALEKISPPRGSSPSSPITVGTDFDAATVVAGALVPEDATVVAYTASDDIIGGPLEGTTANLTAVNLESVDVTAGIVDGGQTLKGGKQGDWVQFSGFDATAGSITGVTITSANTAKLDAGLEPLPGGDDDRDAIQVLGDVPVTGALFRFDGEGKKRSLVEDSPDPDPADPAAAVSNNPFGTVATTWEKDASLAGQVPASNIAVVEEHVAAASDDPFGEVPLAGTVERSLGRASASSFSIDRVNGANVTIDVSGISDDAINNAYIDVTGGSATASGDRVDITGVEVNSAGTFTLSALSDISAVSTAGNTIHGATITAGTTIDTAAGTFEVDKLADLNADGDFTGTLFGAGAAVATGGLAAVDATGGEAPNVLRGGGDAGGADGEKRGWSTFDINGQADPAEPAAAATTPAWQGAFGRPDLATGRASTVTAGGTVDIFAGVDIVATNANGTVTVFDETESLITGLGMPAKPGSENWDDGQERLTENSTRITRTGQNRTADYESFLDLDSKVSTVDETFGDSILGTDDKFTVADGDRMAGRALHGLAATRSTGTPGGGGQGQGPGQGGGAGGGGQAFFHSRAQDSPAGANGGQPAARFFEDFAQAGAADANGDGLGNVKLELGFPTGSTKGVADPGGGAPADDGVTTTPFTTTVNTEASGGDATVSNESIVTFAAIEDTSDGVAKHWQDGAGQSSGGAEPTGEAGGAGAPAADDTYAWFSGGAPADTVTNGRGKNFTRGAGERKMAADKEAPPENGEANNGLAHAVEAPGYGINYATWDTKAAAETAGKRLGAPADPAAIDGALLRSAAVGDQRLFDAAGDDLEELVKEEAEFPTSGILPAEGEERYRRRLQHDETRTEYDRQERPDALEKDAVTFARSKKSPEKNPASARSGSGREYFAQALGEEKVEADHRRDGKKNAVEKGRDATELAEGTEALSKSTSDSVLSGTVTTLGGPAVVNGKLGGYAGAAVESAGKPLDAIATADIANSSVDAASDIAANTANPVDGTILVRGITGVNGGTAIAPVRHKVAKSPPPAGPVAAAAPKPAPPPPPTTPPAPEPPPPPAPPAPPADPEPEVSTADNPVSTFSLNVSDVAFKRAAGHLASGQLPPPAAVRTEEFVNALRYHDPAPAAGAPVALAWDRARSPFAHGRDLLRLSVQTASSGRERGQPLNLVLAVDDSGSMARPDRNGIIRAAMAVLARTVQPGDTLSLIAFARTPRLLADGVEGADPVRWLAQLDALNPQGGTHMEGGLELAYNIARRHYRPGGNNRVILLTDGAANLGETLPETLRQRVADNRRSGVALDVFGIGTVGYNDHLLEALSRNGDGRYGYLNSVAEVDQNFAQKLAGALQVAAADVKVQVVFNPARVTAYRLMGYAKHRLKKEDFRNNAVDAAEIGAAESGTACYTVQVDDAGQGPLGEARVRYRDPATGRYHEFAWPLEYRRNAPALRDATPAARLAAAAATFAEILAENPYAPAISSRELLPLLQDIPDAFPLDPEPRALVRMIRQAAALGR